MVGDASPSMLFGSLQSGTEIYNMPFRSDKQRKLFWAAKSNGKIRRRMGLSRKTVAKILEHDSKRANPKISKATRRAIKST